MEFEPGTVKTQLQDTYQCSKRKSDITEQKNYVYADEADMLNVAMFGKTAMQRRKDNPNAKGNIRDYATISQLLVLANLESYNAILIEQGVEQEKRLDLLRRTVIKQ